MKKHFNYVEVPAEFILRGRQVSYAFLPNPFKLPFPFSPMAETRQELETSLFSDINTRIRDVEEKQRLLKDRVLLIGKNLVEEREKTIKDIQEMKKSIFKLEKENSSLKDVLQRIIEQIDNTARKEELNILQRQFDLFRNVD